MTDALTIQLETDTWDARDCGAGGAYRADGTLGNTAFSLSCSSTNFHNSTSGLDVSKSHEWLIDKVITGKEISLNLLLSISVFLINRK